jgi:hypothetical protein
MQKTIFILIASLTSLNVLADATIDQLQNLGSQQQFRSLSEDLGSALSYKPLSPGEPLGVTGFDIGVEVTGTSIKNKEVLDLVTSGSAPSLLPVPKLHVHKGLGLFDIGGSYSAVPGSNIKLFGAEIRYALLEGTAATPALALRASFSQLTGVDQLNFDTKGVDISISKGFLIAKPYAGIGQVWVSSTPKGVPTLTSEKFTQTKVFAGLNLNFGLYNLAFEADRTGDAATYGAKLGFRF